MSEHVIRWPTKIGGPLDGEPRTNVPAGMRAIQLSVPTTIHVSDFAKEADRREEAFAFAPYRIVRIPFAAGGMRVDVEVQADPDMTAEAVAWSVLSTALRLATGEAPG